MHGRSSRADRSGGSRFFPLPLAALAALLACAGALQAGPRLAVEREGLDATEVAASLALVEAAQARLPPGFPARLPAGVSLRWRDDLPDDVHGRARNGRIGLHRGLLDDWMRSGDQGIAGGTGGGEGVAHPALAALLHELAHVFDRSPEGGLSRDPRLLDLAGWPVRPLRFGMRARHNDFVHRSPDDYERQSPAEYVAVNFEHFLLDPSYACRRPAMHAWLAARFGWSPRQASCADGTPFVATGAGYEPALRLLGIDPARVQRVDYLFAEANERPMSRWGHGMLRLVVCAPGRAPGPDCGLDLEHHVVLSFRAFVDDVQISNWRGLTGAYPSRLFVLPLEQVVDEYTRVELRGLQSVPLRLSRDEIASLLERAAQVHWSYDGRYYFVGNNCAVETWKLLNDGVPRLSREPLRSITPNGLLRRLQREGIADASVLDDPAKALRDGHRFESQAAYYDEMFALADAALGLPAANARAWFDLDPVERAPWLARADLRASAALLLLEQAALRREEAQARQALKQRYLRGGRLDEGDTKAAVAALRELLGNPAYAGRPSALLDDDSYGLPQARERERLAVAVAADGTHLREVQARLQVDLRELVPAQRQRRLQGVEANLERLSRHLRALHAGQDAQASP